MDAPTEWGGYILLLLLAVDIVLPAKRREPADEVGVPGLPDHGDGSVTASAENHEAFFAVWFGVCERFGPLVVR